MSETEMPRISHCIRADHGPGKIRLPFCLILGAVLLLFAVPANAQQGLQDSTQTQVPGQAFSTTCSGIRFEGLKRNKAEFLRRFLSSASYCGTDVPVSVQATTASEGLTRTAWEALAEADAVRLRRLPQIADAQWSLLAPDSSTTGPWTLVFHIEEAWTLYPIANIGGVVGNFWWQAGATELNLAGRGIELAGDVRVIDGRLGGQLRMRLPYIAGSPWGISVSATRQASREPFFFPEQTVQYNYTNYTLQLLGLREINPGHQLEFGGALLLEQYRLNDMPVDFSGPASLDQDKYLGKVRWVLDRTDRRYFWRKGFWQEAIGTVVHTPGEALFWMGIYNGHGYARVGRIGNLAGRLRLGLATNTPSPFAPFVLDSRINLRGSGNRVDRGTATVVLNLEHRQTLVEGRYLAFQAVAFSDAGSWRSPGGGWSDLIDEAQFRWFTGAGLRLIWKQGVDAQLRVDYGINPLDPAERGLVVGLGPYF